MTEEHKQKIRDGVLRKRAEKLAALGISATPILNESPEPDDRPVSEPSPGPLPDPFVVWLKTSEGFYCSDPRVPQDRVRFSIHLEDVLRKAFNAGIRENEI